MLVTREVLKPDNFSDTNDEQLENMFSMLVT